MKKGKKKYRFGSGKVGVQVAQQIPQLLEALFSATGHQSKEPLVDPSIMRSVVSPYAFGGEAGDGTYTQDEIMALQEKADELGMDLEQFLLMAESGLFEDEEDEYSYSEEDLEEGEEEEEEYAMGGVVPIEVEGNEILETPMGEVMKAIGPSHEAGGVDVNVPRGTKIFSDRLAIGGKTMQERKAARVKKINKSERRAKKPYATTVDKSTLKRVKALADKEEQQDMTLQKIADAIYSPPTEKKALGGVAGGVPPSMIPNLLEFLDNPIAALSEPIPTVELDSQRSEDFLWGTPKLQTYTGNRNKVERMGVPRTTSPDEINPVAKPASTGNQNTDVDVENPLLESDFTTGDYVGMGGSVIAGLGPLLATLNNAANSKPNVNRFLGYGDEALDTNESLQDMVARLRQSRRRDVNTSTNTAIARNRNSASSVNTLRALNTATEMGRNKALQAAEDATDNKMISILDRRSLLQNESKLRERTGEEKRDDMDTRDMDNIYSNIAANLANLGVNLQGFGKNLNTNKANQDAMKLLSQLSVNGIAVDKNMDVVNKMLTPEQVQKFLDSGWTIKNGKLRRPRKIKA